MSVKSPNCGTVVCVICIQKAKYGFVLIGSSFQNLKKRRKCSFKTSDFTRIFLEGSHIGSWKIVLSVNHWLSKKWDRDIDVL